MRPERYILYSSLCVCVRVCLSVCLSSYRLVFDVWIALLSFLAYTDKDQAESFRDTHKANNHQREKYVAQKEIAVPLLDGQWFRECSGEWFFHPRRFQICRPSLLSLLSSILLLHEQISRQVKSHPPLLNDQEQVHPHSGRTHFYRDATTLNSRLFYTYRRAGTPSIPKRYVL